MAKPPGQSPLSPEAAVAITVNERLFAVGLLGDFDAAAAARDRAGLRALLAAVHVPERDIEAIVRVALKRPAGYSARQAWSARPSARSLSEKRAIRALNAESGLTCLPKWSRSAGQSGWPSLLARSRATFSRCAR